MYFRFDVTDSWLNQAEADRAAVVTESPCISAYAGTVRSADRAAVTAAGAERRSPRVSA
jgi:hypothetical protein